MKKIKTYLSVESRPSGLGYYDNLSFQSKCLFTGYFDAYAPVKKSNQVTL